MKCIVHVIRELFEYGEIEVEADSVMEAESFVNARIEEGETSLFAWGDKEQQCIFIEGTEELK